MVYVHADKSGNPSIWMIMFFSPKEVRKGCYQFRPFPTEIMGTIPKCLSITQRSEFEKRTEHGLISRK